ncbi:MAG: hypothetical protein JZD41_03330 [Thermoproteus sp.]|nr:hypothetical protein [Thermoproteus sp.]
MQRITRTKSFVFEGKIGDEIASKLSLWGRVFVKGELLIFSIDSGEIKARSMKADAKSSVRRIYIEPACGCRMEIDEIRDFENDTISYNLVEVKYCPQHK